jgi:L-aminopeptidase/D-esterase-like protein
MRPRAAAALLATLALTGWWRSPGVAAQPGIDHMANHTLTAVAGLKVGHHTLAGRPTGCTVVLAEAGAIAGVDVRGAAPGTRDTDLLSPENAVERVHGILLAGGSAFGLEAAGGVMRYLEQRGIGFEFGRARVPIVPAAILFDLGVGDPSIRPGADCGFKAAAAASTAAVQEGSVGAGAGATVGKLRGMVHAMKGGVGSAAITLPSGLVVAALVVTNGVGDVIDPATGAVVAGARQDDGRTFADARTLIRAGLPSAARAAEQTTLVVVATNARLTKAQATKMAQMGHDGLARAISPIHTPVDGDTVFALATGAIDGGNLMLAGSLAAEVTADAVLRAVRQATGAAGIPAVRDLPR